MGRDAGWLTAAGALAQDICGTAPDFVLLPEIPLDEHALLSAIEQRLREKNNVIVVVSEGVLTQMVVSFLMQSLLQLTRLVTLQRSLEQRHTCRSWLRISWA